MQSQPTLDIIGDFLSHLRRRRRALEAIASETEDDTVSSLTFAEALLMRERLRAGDWTLPPQLMLIGPTQSGKSTICNLLLGAEVAEPSPLAGYTRSAQGFVTGQITAAMEAGLEQQFAGRLSRGGKGAAEAGHQAYSLTSITAVAPFGSEPVIVWDTPDFDSVSSRDYRDLVPLVCAMADAILLVVSREKYADQSVWRLLRMIAPIHTPLLICLNKTSAADEAELQAALTRRLQQEEIHHSGIVALPYSGDYGDLAGGKAAGLLRERAFQILPRTPSGVPEAELHTLLDRHWQVWTEPLQRELAAGDWWQSELEAELEQCQEIYQRDYLNNPHYSDVMQRAVLSLLELLEVPGAAAALMRLRKLLTWPARKLQGFFKQHVAVAKGEERNQESERLAEVASHLMLRLRHKVGDRLVGSAGSTIGWWRNLSDQMERQESSLQAEFSQGVDSYQMAFEQDIRVAGEQLYHYLEAHPATLNSLRAARVTTDAAAVALAIKTGGIGLSDLILAPAMLSFVSLLTESALGRYMHGVEEELKAKQLQAVQSKLFDGILRPALQSLPQQMSTEGCYGISQASLEQAEQAIDGLRS